MKINIDSAPLGGGGQVQRVDAQITDAELRDLVANPLELVPAPGAGWFIDVLGAVVVTDIAVGYVVANQLALKAGGSTDLYAALNDTGVQHKGANEGLQEPVPSDENTALQLANNGDDLTDGDPANTLSVRVYFRIEPAAPFGA